jgi:hypothetical protein
MFSGSLHSKKYDSDIDHIRQNSGCSVTALKLRPSNLLTQNDFDPSVKGQTTPVDVTAFKSQIGSQGMLGRAHIVISQPAQFAYLLAQLLLMVDMAVLNHVAKTKQQSLFELVALQVVCGNPVRGWHVKHEILSNPFNKGIIWWAMWVRVSGGLCRYVYEKNIFLERENRSPPISGQMQREQCEGDHDVSPPIM